MSLWNLVFREIAHRKLSFLLSIAFVAVAIACLVGSLTMLRADDLKTQELLGEREAEVEAAGNALKDAMRKITIGLGFNILILAEDEDLGNFHLTQVPQKNFPEQFVTKLAESSIVTVNHLQPIVTQRVDWPELGREIILFGTAGETPIAHRDPKKPMQDLVPPGTMEVGYRLHTPSDPNQRALKKGDKVTLMDREFTVTKLKDVKGSSDDITVFVNLNEAQEMLEMENLVNAILALECNCATVDRVGEIREEISAILPGTQIEERGTTALARAEARNKAAETAKANLERDAASRQQLHEQRAKFSSLLVPLVMFGAAALIGMLAFNNARQRTTEVGMLRAIGLRSGQILFVFLAKALLVGVLGAVAGWGLGFLVGVRFGDLTASLESAQQLFHPTTAIAALLLAPVLATLASWIPALMASRQDPAVLLSGD